jgi:uncharacterized protein YggU (UPF0235/DUF167 family)
MTQITVIAKTNSKKAPFILKNNDGLLTVYVRERPINGRANLAIISLLSDYLNIPKSKIALVRGGKNKEKIFSY